MDLGWGDWSGETGEPVLKSAFCVPTAGRSPVLRRGSRSSPPRAACGRGRPPIHLCVYFTRVCMRGYRWVPSVGQQSEARAKSYSIRVLTRSTGAGQAVTVLDARVSSLNLALSHLRLDVLDHGLQLLAGKDVVLDEEALLEELLELCLTLCIRWPVGESIHRVCAYTRIRSKQIFHCCPPSSSKQPPLPRPRTAGPPGSAGGSAIRGAPAPLRPRSAAGAWPFAS